MQKRGHACGEVLEQVVGDLGTVPEDQRPPLAEAKAATNPKMTSGTAVPGLMADGSFQRITP